MKNKALNIGKPVIEKYTATAEQTAWLSEKFGEVRTTSYTEGNLTATFVDGLGISDGKHTRPIRGYGHDFCNPVGDLFGSAAQIKSGETFVQNGRHVKPDAQIFGTNVVQLNAA